MAQAFEGQDLLDLKDEILQLRARKSQLLDQLRKLERERNQNRAARDELNQVASENFAQVKELKTSRDKNNRAIQELKAVRRSVLEEMRSLIENVKLIQEEIQSLEISEKDFHHSRSIRKRIDTLDWRIQTTPGMGIAEERQLTEEVNRLMDQLGDISVSTEKLKERKELNREINNLRGFLDHSWRDFQDLVEKSQKAHQQLTELYDAGKRAKDEADHQHKEFLQRAAELRLHRDEFRAMNKILREKSSIFKEQRRIQREQVQLERDRATTEMIEEQSEIIKERLSHKKKKTLSIEEMRIMMTQTPDFLDSTISDDEGE